MFVVLYRNLRVSEAKLKTANHITNLTVVVSTDRFTKLALKIIRVTNFK